MKKIALEQTQDFKDKDIDISTAEINGKYPENGYCVNTKVKEMIYVVSVAEKLLQKEIQ